ncbi:hypothetical protein [Gemmobacter sp. 24YEA27]|uniref:hypothetical protein n=1 Tax=Gemmobacter sp. 24YEA27 TaxID=3040672 RepID=UPI0024B3C623|nr:hypothetical protein [Gemmobacter sp. 24YEA27]
MYLRGFASFALVCSLAACGGKADLNEPPMPFGDFVLGHNIIVADNVQKVPISRDATPEEWQKVMQKAVDDRFGQKRYQGSRIYNIGISVDGYALAPPGIPVVAAPKSVLAITANIWDDAKAKKLNDEGKKFTIFEGLSGESVIGTGLTRTKAQQMEALSYNAVQKIEAWLLEHPDWFGLTKDEQKELLAAREAEIEAAEAKPAEDKAQDPAAAATAAALPAGKSATAAKRAPKG